MKWIVFCIILMKSVWAQTVPTGNRGGGGGGGLPKPPSVPDIMKTLPKNINATQKEQLVARLVKLEGQFQQIVQKINQYQLQHLRPQYQFETIIDLYNFLVMQDVTKKNCCGNRNFLTFEVKKELTAFLTHVHLQDYFQYRLQLNQEQVHILLNYFKPLIQDE